MSDTPLTDALREHEDLDSLDDVIESHEKLERDLAAKTTECERLREKVKYYESITTGAEHKAVDAAIDATRKETL